MILESENKENELGPWSLFLFSIPSILSSMLEPITGTVDTALIGRLNTTWLAALAIGAILLSSFTWMFNFLVHASTQGISDAFAKKDMNMVVERIKISTLTALGIGLITAFLLFIFRDYLYTMGGASDELRPFVDEYFSWRLLGHPSVLLFITLNSLIRGLGKVQYSFYIIIFTTFTNVLLSWMFLHPFAMGLKGVALGSVIANTLGFLLCAIVLLKNNEIRKRITSVQIGKSNWLYFGKNSLDLFGRSFTLTACFFLTTRLASYLGVVPLASHQVMLELWLFSSFFIDGVAITANIKGAKFLAQKNKDALILLTRNLLLISLVIGVSFTFSFWFGKSYILSLFTKDLSVLDQINKVWWLVALSQIPAAIAYIYDGLLFGFGQFRYLRKQMIFAFLFGFMPLAIYAHNTQSLTFVWASLIGLALYRVGMGYFGTRKVIIG